MENSQKVADSEEEEDKAAEEQMKIVFVGEANVGKTSIIRRFCYDEFARHYSQTIGADFYMKRICLPDKREVTLKISDVGGLELNGAMLDKYLFKSNCIILVYDITNPGTFDYMNVWIQTINGLIDSPPITAIAGNKCDLEHQRAVRLDKTQQFVRDFELSNFLVSAKTGECVNSFLTEVVCKYFRVPPPLEKESGARDNGLLKMYSLHRDVVAELDSTTSICVLQ